MPVTFERFVQGSRQPAMNPKPYRNSAWDTSTTPRTHAARDLRHGNGPLHTEAMDPASLILSATHIRLEPLALSHAGGLVLAATAAAAEAPSLYRWSPVPQTKPDATRYIETALAWKDAGTAVPFAILRAPDGAVIGSTRFWNIERWAWPQDHPQAARREVDACEIGYTWFTRSALRTAANTEAKFLMLAHAFETWKAGCVCLHTDVRNTRSRAAIERIGGQFEGVLRSHRIAADFTPRDSARYSIVAAEWPAVKERLEQRLKRG
jgi:RimJ/RimL family protein N-acetyltransferase